MKPARRPADIPAEPLPQTSAVRSARTPSHIPPRQPPRGRPFPVRSPFCPPPARLPGATFHRLSPMTSHVYLVLTSILYAVGALHVLLQALTRRRLLTSWTVSATLAGFALHTAGLSQRWTEAGRFPAVGLSDGASFLAWTIVLVFLMTYMRTRVDVLGLAVYPAAFGLVLIANLTPATRSAGPDPAQRVPARPRDLRVLRLRRAVRRLHRRRPVPDPGARAEEPLAARLLLPGAEPGALRHPERPQRRMGLRLPDPRHRHRPALEPRRPRPVLDVGRQGVERAGRVGDLHRADPRPPPHRVGRPARGVPRHRRVRGRRLHLRVDERDRPGARRCDRPGRGQPPHRAARGARGAGLPEGADGGSAAARAGGGRARRGDDPVHLQPRRGLRPAARGGVGARARRPGVRRRPR